MPMMNTVSAIQARGKPKLTTTSAAAATTYMTVSARTPPSRSAMIPPTGRTSEPANTQAAVRYPAVTARQAILAVEVDRQRRGQPDEAAEGDAVEEHEPPGIADLQHLDVLAPALGGRPARAVPCRERDRPRRRWRRGIAARPKTLIQPIGGGQTRGEQRGEHGAGIARPRDAERGALHLRRIPARRQRQRDGESGAGDAEHDAEQQNLQGSCARRASRRSAGRPARWSGR